MANIFLLQNSFLAGLPREQRACLHSLATQRNSASPRVGRSAGNHSEPKALA